MELRAILGRERERAMSAKIEWVAGMPPDGFPGQFLGESKDGRFWVLQWCPKRLGWFGAGHLFHNYVLAPEYRWASALVPEFIVRHARLTESDAG